MLTDDDKEALQELLQSHGWTVFWTKVMAPKLRAAGNESFEAIRKRDYPGASEATAKRDGAVQVAIEAFKAVKEPLPPFIDELRRA